MQLFRRNWAALAFSLLATAGTLLSINASADLRAELVHQSNFARERVALSISPHDGAPGSVMASPSRSYPDYYYHWIRDAALTMQEVLALHREARSSGEKSRWMTRLMDFARFSRQNQLTPNLSGSPGDFGLGEPKFHMDGRAFQEGWGRPQTDGPALRALVMTRLAQQLLDAGEFAVVKSQFYSTELPARTLIKADLEFVSHHWRRSSFDLWEEIEGLHFYTWMVQQRALHEGAELALRMGDPSAAAWYSQQAQAIRHSLQSFWNSQKNIIVPTMESAADRQRKPAQLDIAIILAVLHSLPAEGSRDSFIPVTDERVLATAHAIVTSFDQIYGVNRVQQNRNGERMAPGIGRYPEDVYDGVSIQGRGNPWFLTTHAMAEYHYRLARALKRTGSLALTSKRLPFFKRLQMTSQSPFKGVVLRAGDRLVASQLVFQQLVQAVQEEGDAYMRRSLFHTKSGGDQSEQFNRESGFMQGAEHLTWSYVSFLTAVRAR